MRTSYNPMFYISAATRRSGHLNITIRILRRRLLLVITQVRIQLLVQVIRRLRPCLRTRRPPSSSASPTTAARGISLDSCSLRALPVYNIKDRTSDEFLNYIERIDARSGVLGLIQSL